MTRRRVVVHRHDPGRSVHPAGHRPRRVLLQRLHHRVQRLVPGPAAGQPRAGADSRMHPVRGPQRVQDQPGRPGPPLWPRRQWPLVQVAHPRLAQPVDLVTALQRDHLVQADPAAQRRRQHAARAGAHDQIDIVDRHRQPVLNGLQRTRHPGRPDHTACPQHQPNPSPRRPSPSPRRPSPPARRPSKPAARRPHPPYLAHRSPPGPGADQPSRRTHVLPPGKHQVYPN